MTRALLMESGAGLFLIAAQSSDLGAELGRSLKITSGQGDRKGELQLLQLVISFLLRVAAKLAVGCRTGGPRDTVLGVEGAG